jgi:quercetin dioxygenase-like cupin family protein
MSEQLMRDLSLMLMYLSSWTEHNDDAPRFWKGFDFGILNHLDDEGLIADSRHAKSAYLTEAGVRRARELIAEHGAPRAEAGQNSTPGPAIVHLFAGVDQLSHFEDVELRFQQQGDRSESAELIADSGMLVRRFETGRTNPWHHAPGRYAVFTLRGAVDIEVGDGSVRRIGPGQVLIADDESGQGHETREVGPEPRVSVFVPLP